MAVKSLYTKKLGAVVAKGAHTNNSNKYHVIAGDSHKWMVVPKGSIRALRVFTSLPPAVIFAKQIAERRSGEVVIHTKAGDVSNTISFMKN